MVFGFTGSGNVSRGAQEIFDRLPTQEIFPEDLSAVASDPDRPRNILYKVVLRREHRFERREGGPFDGRELDAHPERYASAMPRWLPNLTVVVHGAYWKPEQPRLIGVEDLRSLWKDAPQPRLRLIADISCDIGGGIETTVRATTPSDPTYVYEIETGDTPAGVAGRGPVMLTMDNFPCELPVESSQHFGDAVVRFVPALDRCDWSRSFEDLELPAEIRRAIIAHCGRLTPGFAYLEKSLEGA
jgi:alpha-aminoadipic semialdehyde synthase